MSGSVSSDMSKSDMVENVGVAVGIASKSVSVQKLFPLPVSTSGFVADILVSDADQCRQCHIRVTHGRKYGGSR